MNGNNHKIRRNDPCPCGSGKKYEECCLNASQTDNTQAKRVVIPEEVVRKFQEHLRSESLRQQKFGQVRHIVSEDFHGYKFVAVGNELYYFPAESCRTFPDFLMKYIKLVLGIDWGKGELAKPYEERHQILKWYDGMCRFQSEQKPGSNGLYSAIPNGAFAAYLHLAYDLYTLRNNSELQQRLIDRIKIKDQFQGARYELFAAATCCRAGFEIEFEDETDGSKGHPEFVATHKQTGQKISVEAKSRHRPGVLDFRGERSTERQIKADIGQLLSQALKKPTEYPFVIFIDLNLPPVEGDIKEQALLKEIEKTVKRICGTPEEAPDKFNLIIFTNIPHHYGDEKEPDPPKEIWSVLSERPKNTPSFPNVITGIDYAALQYVNIPNDFPE